MKNDLSPLNFFVYITNRYCVDRSYPMRRTLTKAFELHNSNFYFLSLIADNSHLIPTNLVKTLLAIARFHPNSFPSQNKISEMTGRSLSSVKRDVDALEKLGFITVVRQHRKANQYSLSVIALNPKRESLGVIAMNRLGVIAVNPFECHSYEPPSYNYHINYHIGSDHEVLTEKEKQERQEMVEDYKKKKALKGGKS